MTDQTPIKTLSADELRQLEIQDNKLYEVLDGQLREKPMTTEKHGQIEALLIFLLMQIVKPRNLGRVYPGDMTYVLEGTKQRLVRALKPDVSFIRASRLSAIDPDDFLYIPPDLAIEIISPSERPAEVDKKIAEYLQFGVEQVWSVYPDEQTVTVHTQSAVNHYSSEDAIPLDLIAGGEEIKVAEIFE